MPEAASPFFKEVAVPVAGEISRFGKTSQFSFSFLVRCFGLCVALPLPPDRSH